MSLPTVLAALGVSQSELCREALLSRSVVSRIVTHGDWPTRDLTVIRQRLEQVLRTCCVRKWVRFEAAWLTDSQTARPALFSVTTPAPVAAPQPRTVIAAPAPGGSQRQHAGRTTGQHVAVVVTDVGAGLCRHT